jgi:hypothetical protein
MIIKEAGYSSLLFFKKISRKDAKELRHKKYELCVSQS